MIRNDRGAAREAGSQRMLLLPPATAGTRGPGPLRGCSTLGAACPHTQPAAPPDPVPLPPLPVPSASLLWTVCWRRCPAARRGSVLVCRGSWRAPVLCFAPSSPAWGGGVAARTLRGCRSGGAGGTGPGGRAEPSRQVEPWRPGCPAETAAPCPLPAGSRRPPRGAGAAPCLGSALGLCGQTPEPPDPPTLPLPSVPTPTSVPSPCCSSARAASPAVPAPWPSPSPLPTPSNP